MLLSWCLSTATQGEAGGMQRTGNRPTTTRERFTSGETHTESGEESEEGKTEGKGRNRRERETGDREDVTEGKLRVRLLEGGGRGETEKSETSEGA